MQDVRVHPALSAVGKATRVSSLNIAGEVSSFFRSWKVKKTVIRCQAKTSLYVGTEDEVVFDTVIVIMKPM